MSNRLLSTLIITLVLLLAGCGGGGGGGSDNESNCGLELLKLNNNLGGTKADDTYQTIADSGGMMISFLDVLGSKLAEKVILNSNNVTHTAAQYRRYYENFVNEPSVIEHLWHKNGWREIQGYGYTLLNNNKTMQVSARLDNGDEKLVYTANIQAYNLVGSADIEVLGQDQRYTLYFAEGDMAKRYKLEITPEVIVGTTDAQTSFMETTLQEFVEKRQLDCESDDCEKFLPLGGFSPVGIYFGGKTAGGKLVASNGYDTQTVGSYRLVSSSETEPEMLLIKIDRKHLATMVNLERIWLFSDGKLRIAAKKNRCTVTKNAYNGVVKDKFEQLLNFSGG